MNKYFLILLFVLSCLTHLLFFPRPAEVVFDEVYFGAYASDYISGKYYFDPHPPLGKLLIAATGRLSGITNDATSYAAIGDKYQTDIYVWYRLLPLIAGILLPLVVYWLCRRLRLSALAAFSAGLLVILENSLLVQSRFIFLDSMLLLFGFSALASYLTFRARRASASSSASKDNSSKRFFWWLAASSLAGALAFDIKWTGLAFSLIIVLVELWDVTRSPQRIQALKRSAGVLTTMILVGFFVYLATFAVHFALLPRSGQGNPFMSASFQKTLVDSSYHDDSTLRTPDFLDKFVETNLEMYGVNAHMNATHPYSSKWYTWPLMARPIFYWEETASSTIIAPAKASTVSNATASASTYPATTSIPATVPAKNSYIYLIGNPFIYWLGALAIASLAIECLWLLVLGFIHRNQRMLKPVPVFLVVAFCANFLPFIFIGRVMFLYHYQAALVFTIIAIACVLDQLKGRLKYILIGATLLIALSAFIFWSPLTYGLPLTQGQLQERMWFPSWR